MKEADTMRLLQMEASRQGARLFRQNTGMAWAGTAVKPGITTMMRVGPRDVLVKNARPFHAGHKGMADLGGWVPVTITPEMIGVTVAVYLQVEVKADTRATPEQAAWIDAVKRAGGRAGVAHDVEELLPILAGT